MYTFSSRCFLKFITQSLIFFIVGGYVTCFIEVVTGVEKKNFENLLYLLLLTQAFSAEILITSSFSCPMKNDVWVLHKEKLQKSRMNGLCKRLVYGILSKSKKNLNIVIIVGMVLLFSKLSIFMNDVGHCKVHIYILDLIKWLNHPLIRINQAFLIVFKLPLTSRCIWTFSLTF